jgi:hypothetical protein
LPRLTSDVALALGFSDRQGGVISVPIVLWHGLSLDQFDGNRRRCRSSAARSRSRLVVRCYGCAPNEIASMIASNGSAQLPILRWPQIPPSVDGTLAITR